MSVGLALAFAAAWLVIAAAGAVVALVESLRWLDAHTTLPRWASRALVLWVVFVAILFLGLWP